MYDFITSKFCLIHSNHVSKSSKTCTQTLEDNSLSFSHSFCFLTSSKSQLAQKLQAFFAFSISVSRCFTVPDHSAITLLASVCENQGTVIGIVSCSIYTSGVEPINS
ncbi:hypothetical protein HOG27_02250 [bacterium]|nr:hypothetical protein [bacterium]